MFLPILFAISGLVIVTLIGAKILEDKRKSKPLVLRLVSLGDERVRNWGIEFAHRYSDFKTQGHFFITNQLPLRSKNYFNKLVALAKEKFEERVGDIRGSKLLKKSDGLSEYLKSISEKNEAGRIDEEMPNNESRVEDKE